MLFFRLWWANEPAQMKETEKVKSTELDFGRITRITMAKIQWLGSLIISISSPIHFSTVRPFDSVLAWDSFLSFVRTLISIPISHSSFAPLHFTHVRVAQFPFIFQFRMWWRLTNQNQIAFHIRNPHWTYRWDFLSP